MANKVDTIKIATLKMAKKVEILKKEKNKTGYKTLFKSEYKTGYKAGAAAHHEKEPN